MRKHQRSRTQRKGSSAKPLFEARGFLCLKNLPPLGLTGLKKARLADLAQLCVNCPDLALNLLSQSNLLTGGKSPLQTFVLAVSFCLGSEGSRGNPPSWKFIICLSWSLSLSVCLPGSLSEHLRSEPGKKRQEHPLEVTGQPV